jgi:hypothetical protein
MSAEDANTIIDIVGKAKVVGNNPTAESSDSKTAGQLAALDALTGKASGLTREARGAKTRPEDIFEGVPTDTLVVVLLSSGDSAKMLELDTILM